MALIKQNSLFADVRVQLSVTVLFVIFGASLFAPILAGAEIGQGEISRRLCSPSLDHPFGCDVFGEDVFTSMLYGGRLSLLIAITTVSLSLSVGLVIGLLSGFYRGVFETVSMRFVDVLMAIPGILVAMILASLLGPSALNIVLAIAATGWTSSARLVRGEVLKLRELEYVTASRSLGANDFRLIIRHILPGTFTPLIVQGTFSLSGVIIIEASLSFLGLGAQGSVSTWGGLLAQARSQLLTAPHLSLIPGLAILLVVLSLNFLGDALRDHLDPKKIRST